MKRILFSLFVLVAMVLVVNTANAQTNVTPYTDVYYEYTLSGVAVNTAASSSITISCENAAGTIDADSIYYGSAKFTNGGEASTTASNLTFRVKYSSSATGYLKVVVVDGGAGSCSNEIQLNIAPVSSPTVDLSIADLTGTCQAKVDAGNNTDEVPAAGSLTDTIVFTVTVAETDVPSSYSGTASLSLGGADITTLTDVKIDGIKTAVTGVQLDGATLKWDNNVVLSSGEFTVDIAVVFTTVEGKGDLDIALLAADVSITEGSESTKFDESDESDNKGSTTVYAMPSIGTFTIE